MNLLAIAGLIIVLLDTIYLFVIIAIRSDFINSKLEEKRHNKLKKKFHSLSDEEMEETWYRM
jgi:hypothetical protein